MRKNCARKWLHLVIDLLPILIIPIFAIWEINHANNEPITVEIDKHEIVDFNQIVPADYKDVVGNYGQYVRVLQLDGLFVTSHTYFINFDVVDTNEYVYAWCYGNPSTQLNSYSYSIRTVGNHCFTRTIADTSYNNCYFGRYNASGTALIDIDNYFIVDLTQMFGYGNEPTAETFKSLYGDEYYSYNLSHKELITNGTIVYDNTDIGSQMLYAVYKPVQQYFNFDNIFNFGALRNWFELNFFNGNMGIPMTIIWNIIIYEFLSDVIMLIYAFFMFIIDFANDLLEKPFSYIKRG